MSNTDINQPIWRYMRLETLLLLLKRRKLFLPTLSKLQSDDPNEGEIIRRADLQDSDQKRLEQVADWLVQRANGHEKEQMAGESRTNVLREIWLRELAKRRLVWCWHAACSESMAQWQIYAHKGVAIRSTPAAVKEALQPEARFVNNLQHFAVRYLKDSESPSGQEALTRPFLFKRDSFRYEEEIRFVMTCIPPEPKMGMCLSSVPVDFIEEIVVSPFVLEEEAFAVTELMMSFFHNSEKPPNIHRSTQLSAPTKTTFLDEVFSQPDESVLEASEPNVPPELHKL